MQVHYIEKNEGVTNKDFRIVLKVCPPPTSQPGLPPPTP